MREKQVTEGRSTNLSPFAKMVIGATFTNWVTGVHTTCNDEQFNLLGVGATWIPSSQNGENHAS